MFIPVPQRVNNKLSEDFYPLQKEELIALRKAKLINNAAYVHLALRYENPYCDRPVQIVPKQFALRWQIPETSVYKALAKLKELRVLIIKTGKLVIDWVIKPSGEPKLNSGACPTAHSAPDDEASNPVSEQVTEPVAVDELSHPTENYQIEQKIIKFDNELSDREKNYQNRENRGLKPLSDIGSEISQTLQTLQTNQTEAEGRATFSKEQEQPKTEVVHEQIQTEEQTSEEKNLVTKSEAVEKTSRDVVCESSKIIYAKRSQPEEIPADLKEKLRELEIPLDRKVLSAIASHDISQAYGAAAHIENTWHTITKPRSVFLYQLPKQPIEKLGSRYSEELLNKIHAQNRAIDEERKTPEYQIKMKETFDQIRAILDKGKR